ncbi:hypothetical protein NQD34_003514 [Periophthalmus magnuspinnatus]|nr:hypothetical protein NQD34_003514 [Periophthalmus magnuspinnatus]
MNPDSLDSSIQSLLSSLFPPFELTAPVVLSQLFRTIEERYHGDALHCLLDFLIPAKHVLESVQQAACAGFCDVVFRFEGWPLCLHDQTVVQLAPVNPLLLRPGDFYLQVTPFGDQAARIVLKSLLEEGCREVEETPIPETSYPIIFTLEWLQELNEGRHGVPLSRCLLCTDQGILKLPWDKIAVPEFIDKPKTVPIMPPICPDPEPKPFAQHLKYNSSTLPLEMHHPAKYKMSASLRHPQYSSRVIKPDKKSKAQVKPVGWVSPNTWDRPTDKGIEGDYVDLVEIAKEKERLGKNERKVHPGLIKAFRPPQPKLGTQCLTATLQYSENPFVPCGDFGISDEELKNRYRESYMAALKNPVALEKGNVDFLSSLDELKYLEQIQNMSIDTSNFKKERLGTSLDHGKDISNQELCQFKEFCEPATVRYASHLKDLKKASELSICTNDIAKKDHLDSDFGAIGFTDAVSEGFEKKSDFVKASGKHKFKIRSLSAAASEGLKGIPLLHSRSHSDVGPETMDSLRQRETRAETELRAGTEEPRKSLLQTESQSNPSAPEPEAPPLQALPPPESVCAEPSAPPEEGALTCITPLLQLGVVCLPGSRDRAGRAAVEVYGDRDEWCHPLVTAQNICKLLLHLHSLPRREVSDLGLTLIINSKKKNPPPPFYQALLMAQEQALHTVHCIVQFVDKDSSPRPEKLSGLQMDVVSSLKSLNKTVESCELSAAFGGTFVFCLQDWLQLHQRIVPFLSDLKAADSLLQRAIQKVEGARKLETAQEVALCVEEQRALMLEVLRDPGLVALQREGGSILARVRKDQPRFPHSHDYRDWLDSASQLYNTVEEKLHSLVIKSNLSLERLEALLCLRQAESCVSETGGWWSSEAEQVLKESWPLEETLSAAQQALEHFKVFITQAREKQESSSKLMKNAVKILQSTTESSPTATVLHTLVSTFQSNMADFMVRAERRHRDLQTLEQVYSFCQQASSFAEECSDFLSQLDTGCSLSPSDPSPTSDPSPPPDPSPQLHMYQSKLGAEFSTSRFQSIKSLIPSLTPGAARVWNAAWERRQNVQLLLDQIQLTRKNCVAYTSKSSADCQESKPTVQDGAVTSYKELCSSADGRNPNGGSANASEENGKDKSVETVIQKPREHSSEADLTHCKTEFPFQKQLGRSLSEGSKFKPKFTLLSDLNVCQKVPREEHPKSGRKLSLPCNPLEGLRRGGGDGEGGVSPRGHHIPTETIHSPAQNNGTNVQRLSCILSELLSTEREYVRALGFVREHYCPELERPDVPQELRGQKGAVFSNLEKIHEFHRHHFLPELERCVDEPIRVGRCFLRHSDSFALYALYSKNKPVSDRLLIAHGKTFFKQKQVSLGDRMDLWSYLLKPVQRISKYSLLLQDVLRECGPEHQGALEEVRQAVEVVQSQLRHGNNLLAMDAIQNCDVNLKEQGALFRQGELMVTFRKKKCLRHVFLFQELILFSKTRKNEVGNETYEYKQSFKTCDIGLTQNSGDSGLCFEIWFRKRKSQDTYTLQAEGQSLKDDWTRDLEKILWEQALRNKEVRLQERLFLGLGNKPFKDIQPSDAAINSREVHCGLLGKDSRAPSLSSFGSSGSRDVLPVMRQKSIGSCSSSSSSSSGRGSLSPGRYMSGPQGGSVRAGHLEEDELDQDRHNLLLDGSECEGDDTSICSSVKHSETGSTSVGKSTEV